MAQARRKKRRQTARRALFSTRLRRGLYECVFIALLGLAVWWLLTLLSFNRQDPGWTHTGGGLTPVNWGGTAGAWVADLTLYFFGHAAYLLPAVLALFSWRLFRRRRPLDWEFVFYRLLGAAALVSAACGLAQLIGAPVAPGLPGGGAVGVLSTSWLNEAAELAPRAVAAVLTLLLLAGLSLLTDWSWPRMMELMGRSVWMLGRALLAPLIPLRRSQPRPERGPFDPRQKLAGTLGGLRRLGERLRPWFSGANQPLTEPLAETAPTRRGKREPFIGTAEPAVPQAAKPTKRKTKKKPPPVEPDSADTWTELPLFDRDAEGGNGGPLPALTLLEMPPPEAPGYSSEILVDMAERLKALLRDFGVEVEVVNATPGPVITRFELDPAPGVKGTQISNLAKDLARGLSVVSVRIEEIIPGKPYIGLEIPNQQRSTVFLSEVLGSSGYRKSPSPLTLALGKDIAGRSLAIDLASMPHLLVAGTTGSGKSVAVNAMLLSILFKASPADVRLIMIDPKMLELSIYDGIPHLLAPVVTDMKEAANALRWCVVEMERRYRLLSALKVRHIRGYNQKVNDAIKRGKPLRDPLYEAPNSLEEVPTLQPLPYVVVVIDELADMMMTVGKKVEELIVRLAQKARAAGIHLILATQRPSVDVITGLIKSNVPARMAFQVASKIDSRTILDQSGAESLLGHGDMLLLSPAQSGIPQRLHGAFVADHEVHQVVDFLKNSTAPGEYGYAEEVLAEPAADPVSVGADGLPSVDGETDPLYDQAVRIVIETRRATISSLQRRLGIGYNRSARIIEAMENAGLISPQQPNGSREILVNATNEEGA